MHLLKELWRRWQYWRRTAERDRDLQDELEFHLAMRAERNREKGLPAAEARRQARLSVGNTAQLLEDARAAWIWPWLESVAQDVRYAFRGLGRQPGFAVTVTLSLALGIGANTSVFTLIQGLLLKDLPVRNPEELMILEYTARTNPPAYRLGGSGRKDPDGRFRNNIFTYPAFETMRQQTAGSAELLAYVQLRDATVVAGGAASIAPGFAVSGSFYQVLGVRAAAGRLIEPADDAAGSPPVAVISFGLWQRAFAGSPDAVGRTMHVNGYPATVIGITPSGFTGLSRGGWIRVPDVTLPLHAPAVAGNWKVRKPDGAANALYSDPDVFWLCLMARLRPDAGPSLQSRLSLAFAQAESAPGAIWRDPGDAPRLDFKPGSRGAGSLGQRFAQPLNILMVIVGVVLLVACANVANLLLARTAARRQELAFRLALGAPRARLVRQMLVESAVLAVLGAAAGLALAYPGVPLLLNLLAAPSEGIAVQPQPDLAVLWFTLVILTLTVFAVGLAPALLGTRVNAGPGAGTQAVRHGSRVHNVRPRLRGALVIVQVTLSVVLLVAAGLFVRTLGNLRSADTGFRPEGLVVFGLNPMRAGYTADRTTLLFTRVIEAIERTPGVSAVSYAADRLLADWNSTSLIRLPESNGVQPRKSISWNAAGPGYLSTIGAHLLAGREIESGDTANSPMVAVVNESAAREFFHGAALGRRFYRSTRGTEVEVQVIGVVADAMHSTIRAGKRPLLYLPLAQSMGPGASLDFVVRTSGDPRAYLEPLRAAVRRIDPNLPVLEIRTQSEQIGELMRRERMFAILTSVFAGLAVLLSCLGLYGLIAYGVARRIPEIGLRLALGASGGRIFWLFTREALLLAAGGVVVAIPLVLAGTRLIRSQLYGVDAADPSTIAAAGAGLALLAGLAALIPAARAASVAPAAALRHE